MVVVAKFSNACVSRTGNVKKKIGFYQHGESFWKSGNVSNLNVNTYEL